MQMTTGEIAGIVDGQITGDARIKINGVAVFEAAAPTDITYIDNARFLKKIGETRAGGVIVPDNFNGPAPCWQHRWVLPAVSPLESMPFSLVRRPSHST